MQKWKTILAFAVSVNVIAWLGAGIAFKLNPGNAVLQPIGLLILSLSPLIVALVLGRIEGKKWMNKGFRIKAGESFGWYLFSFLYPVLLMTSVICLVLFLHFGTLNVSEPSVLSAIPIKFLALLTPFLLASIGEEFGWRGFLEPELIENNGDILGNHLFTGLIWGVWHLPLIVLSPDGIKSWPDLILILTSVLFLSIVYGYLRIRSKTVWTCVFLHAFANTLTITLASSGLIEIKDDYKYLVSFNTSSIFVITFYAATAIVLFIKFPKRLFKPES